MRTRSRASPASGRVSFSNVTYSEKGSEFTVFGDELKAIYHQLAHHNNCSVDDLLNGDQVAQGEELKCVILNKSPSGQAWSQDRSGYLMLFLRSDPTPRGRSFLASPVDATYEPPQGLMEEPMGSKTPAPYPHSPRPSRTKKRSCMLYDPPDTPNSDGGMEGCSQAVQVRLHRAAAIAASKDPSSVAALDILHICGRKHCGVVGHFRPGSGLDNSLDLRHHSKRPGTSRLAWDAL